MVLMGSEVKSLRAGLAQLQEAYATIEHGELYLCGCYIDPYSKAALVYNHEPRRQRKLLLHKRERVRLEAELATRGTTLIPLAIYFKEGRATMRLDLDQETAKFTAEIEKAKLELKRESEARMKDQFKLAREQFEFDAAKACLKALPALKQISTNKSLSEADKVNAIRSKLFAVLPK